MFELEFNTKNAAYRDEDGEVDSRVVAESLNEVTREVLNGDRRGSIIDSNGNIVGKWELSE